MAMQMRIIDACSALELMIVIHTRTQIVIHPDTYKSILLAYYGDPED